MKKIIRSTFIIFLCLIIILPMFISASTTNQIDYVGGETVSNDDMVRISKTIEHKEGDLENYFDITLKVETKNIAEEPSLDIVIVMDVSNTMNYVFTGTTAIRIAAAQDAAKKFITDFANRSASNKNIKRSIGFVAFNTNAQEIFNLQPCMDTTTANGLINNMITKTNNIMNATNYDESHSRFTNIEAGLKMAKDMLNKSNASSKHIIFLSDGFPTTYIYKNYTGYDPYMTPNKPTEPEVNRNKTKFFNDYWNAHNGILNPDDDGIFYDRVEGHKYPCYYGTSYSDKAAIRAREMATKIKNSGINIYSIGVDIGGQTIKKYVDQTVGKKFSVVDRTSTTYEIGSDSSSDAYKDWLRNSIGSGNYNDADDPTDLTNKFEEIFQKIIKMSEAAWVIEDPMNNSSNENKFIEFVGLYDDKNVLKDSITNGNPNESDTANYSNDTLKWDLKNSTYTGPTKTIINGKEVEIYTYEVKYRVRLKNEASGFIVQNPYETNGETKLTYLVKKTNSADEQKTITFKNPKVHGYLGELNLIKLNKFDRSKVKGAKFKLVHDPDCLCHKERKYATILDMEVESDEFGNVSFKNIPSGHKYLLSEISTLNNLIKDLKTYNVSVDYGETKIEGLTNNEFINDYKKGSLEIEKIVSGTGSKDGKFTFIIKATYNNQLVKNKTFNYTGSRTGTITFDNEGKIRFELANNEKIKILDLPIDTIYEIEEINTDGYVVKTEINGNITIGNKVNITQSDTNKVKFINITSYELPATGSSRMLILIIIGSLLLGLPIIYIGYIFYKKKFS